MTKLIDETHHMRPRGRTSRPALGYCTHTTHTTLKYAIHVARLDTADQVRFVGPNDWVHTPTPIPLVVSSRCVVASSHRCGGG